jgi:hypothetical protein
MSNVSNPTASVAVVAALVLSGISAGAPTASAAAAANCAAAPNTAAPAGQHWYYHFDRSAHRKCWYLHATVALAHHAAADTPAAAAESSGADPASAQHPAATLPSANADPPAETDAAVPPSATNADSAQPEPGSAAHVTVLTVKTVPEPFVSTAAQSPQQPPENVDTPSAQPTVPSDQTTAGAQPTESAGQAPPPVPAVARADSTSSI